MHTRAAFQPCKTDRRVRRPSRKPAPAVATFAASLSFGASAVAVAGPTGGVVTQGQGTISTPSATQTVVNQSSQQLMLNWNTFNVAADESVRFYQPSSSAIAFNHILDQNPSQIFGSVSANGKIVLVNPNGLLIGRTATLNVNSLVVSSLDAIDFDPTSGRYRFSATRTNPGAVSNAGTITAQPGGSVTLLGGTVSNSGTIVADYGTVNLAAGRVATLDLAGDGLLQLEVGGELLDNPNGAAAAVDNSGSVRANGGHVLLTASALQNVFTNLVNNSGVVRANRINNSGGTIELLGPGGTVESSGTLDASAGDAASTGGSVEVLGDRVGLMNNAVVNVSGATGGGTALIGGDQHGTNPNVLDASDTYVSPNATIDADAGAQGNGGKVVVWSNEYTNYSGSLSARGGSLWGDGGAAEISSKQILGFYGTVDLTAVHGKWGTLLLDPPNITIDTAGTDPLSPPNPFTPPASVTITPASIVSALATSNVSLVAGDSIIQDTNGTINATGSNSLGLHAGSGDVQLTAPISVGGSLSIISDQGNITATSAAVLGATSGVTLTTSGTSGSIGTAGSPVILSGVPRVTASSAAGDVNLSLHNAMTLNSVTATSGNVTVVSNSDITVETVTAGSTGSSAATLTSSASILGDGTGSGVSGSHVNLTATQNVGAITNFGSAAGTPVVVDTANLTASSSSATGVINLELAPAIPTHSNITLNSGAAGNQGAVLIQSPASYDIASLGAGSSSIVIGAGTTQVGFVSAGTLNVSSSLPTDVTPATLLLRGADIASDSVSTPHTISLPSANNIVAATAPANDLELDTTGAATLTANIGGTHNLTIVPGGNLVLGAVTAGGDVSVAGAGGAPAAVQLGSVGNTTVQGAGVNFSTTGAGNSISLSGSVSAGADGVTLSTNGNGSAIIVGDGVTPNSISDTGSGAISITTAGTNSPITLEPSGSLSAAGGGVTVKTSAANSSINLHRAVGDTSGGTLTVQALDDSSGITLSSTLSSSGAIHITSGDATGGALTLIGTNVAVTGGGDVFISGLSVGTGTSNALPVTANQLTATATGTTGGIYVTTGSSLEVKDANAQGVVNITDSASTASTLKVDAASGTGVTLATTGTGNGNSITVSGAVQGGASGVSLSTAGTSSPISVATGGSLDATGAGGVTVSAPGAGSTIAIGGTGINASGTGAVSIIADATVSVAAVSGAGVTLKTTNTGAGSDITVTGAVSGGNPGVTLSTVGTNSPISVTSTGSLSAGTTGVTVSATGVGSGVSLVGGVTDTGGPVSVTADKTVSVAAVSGNDVTLQTTDTAGSITINGAVDGGTLGVSMLAGNANSLISIASTGSIGGSTRSVTVNGNTTDADVSFTGSVAAIGSVSISTDRAITVGSVSGATVQLITHGTDPGTGVTVNGTVNSTGISGTTVNTAGAITTGASGSIGGATEVTLTGASLGTGTSGRVSTATPTLTATSTGTSGNIYLQQQTGDLALTATAATGGTVDALTGNGTLTANAISGTGLVLSASGAGKNLVLAGPLSSGTGSMTFKDVGTGGAIDVNTTLNPTSGGVTLVASNTAGTSGNAINVAAPITVTGTASLTADGAVTDATGQNINATTLIVTGGSIGTPGQPLVTNSPGVTLTSTTGGTYLHQTGGLLLSAASAGDLQVTTNGALTLGGASGAVVTLDAGGVVSTVANDTVNGSTSVTVQGASIGIPGTPFLTNTPSLSAASTSGNISVQQSAQDLSLSATASGGAVTAATTGASSLTVLGASGTGVTLDSGANLTVNGAVAGGSSSVALNAAGAILAGANNNVANPVSGSGLTVSASSIGTNILPLVTSVPAITTSSTNGSTYVTQPSGDLTITSATAAHGGVNIQTQNGSLTETAVSGTGITLVAGGAGKTLTVGSSLDAGAGDLVLEATGGNVALSGPVATTGALTVSAGGALSTVSGVTFTGGQVNLAATSLGNNTSPLTTFAGTSLSATSSGGDIYISQSGSTTLAANATGGVANVSTQNGSLTVTSASGNNVTLAAGGAGSGIAVDGTIAAPSGTVQLTASGGITANTSGLINANTLNAQGSAIGAPGAGTLNLNVGSLVATANSGGIYVADSGALSLTAGATGGPVDASAGGALSVVSASGNGLNLSTGAAGQDFVINGSMNGGTGPVTLTASGAGSSITLGGVLNAAAEVTLNATSAVNVNSAINTTGGVALNATGSGGSVNLNAPVTASTDVTLNASGAGGALNLNAPISTLTAVTLTAGTTASPGSIVAGSGGLITAGTLTATGAAIGTSTGLLPTAVGTLDATSSNGGIYVSNTGYTGSLALTANAPGGTVDVATGGALNVASATGSNVTLTASGGIAETGGAVISGSTVALQGASLGTTTAALNTNATTLDVTSTNGGIYVAQSGPVSLTATATGGAANAQVNGALTITSASGDGVALATTATGAAINVNGAVAGGAAPVALFSNGAINLAAPITSSAGVVLTAGSTTPAAITVAAGEQISGASLTATGMSIGSSSAPLATSVGTLSATSSNGGIYLAQSGGDVAFTANATGGPVALTAGGNVALNVAGTGAVSITAAGAVTTPAGDSVTGNALTLSGASIGTLTAPLLTATGTLNATGTNGGIYVQQTNGLALTAGATGGPVDVQTGGSLTVAAASGTGVALTTTATGSAITLDGAVNGGTGNVTLTTPGAITGGTGEQITAASLTASGSAIGSAATPLNTSVGALNTTSTNGGTYIVDDPTVTLTASATGGPLNVQATNGSIVVDSATGAGITLTASAIAVDGNVNAGTSDVTLNAGSGAISAGSGTLVTAGTLTATGSSIGSSATSLNTAIGSLTANASSGGIYISQQGGLALQNVQATGDIDVSAASGDLTVGTVTAGNNATLTASAGTIKDVDANANVSANTLTLSGLSIGAPSTLTGQTVDTAPRLNTNATNLVATSTDGGVYINQANGLASASVQSSGGNSGNIELVTAKGDINIQSMTASGTLLLAAGGNIYDLPGAGTISAQAAELRAGGSDTNAGHIGSLAHPLVLKLNPGDTLRMFVPQTINPNSASSGPATLPSPGVQSTVSLFLSPNLLAVEDGFDQFLGLGETPFTSQAQVLVRNIQNQTATVQSVVGIDWASFDPNVSLFGKLDPSVCMPSDQRDEEQAAPAGADKCSAAH